MQKQDKFPLTAIVLTRNEADNIVRCLSSLLWCGEVVLIDDSTDLTVEHARKLIPKDRLRIIKSVGRDNFSALRNQALKQARFEWVFFVDADEEVPQALKQEIARELSHPTADGYYIKRKDFFLGKWLRYGETGQIKHIKLGRKNAGLWSRRVHEVWNIHPCSTLGYPLHHYPHPTLAEFSERIDRWTTVDAQEFFRQGKKTSVWLILAYPLAKFIHNYIIKLGFLDGMPGIIFAIMMSFHSYLTRAKLYFLSHA